MTGLLVAAAVAFAAPVARAQSDEPTIQVSKSPAAPGETVIVTLGGWSAPVNVKVCDNEARRGAVDCDQVSGVALGASIAQPQRRELILTVPPTKCPCVLRAATAGGQVVKTVPIVLEGVGTAPVSGPSDAAVGRLKVSAALIAQRVSFGDRVKSALGGPTRRTLRLTLTNAGPTTLSDVTLSAAVARGAQGGDPLQSPNIEPLAPGQIRSYQVAVRLAPPSFGSYTVFGTVYGGGTPITFAVDTSTTPWALVLIALLLLADLVAVATIRLRRRRLERRAYVTPPSRDADLQVNES